MAAFVDPVSGERYNNVPADEADRAQAEFGLVPAEEYDLQKKAGSFSDQLKTVGEEAIRSTAQIASALPGIDAGAAPEGLTELEDGQQVDALDSIYSGVYTEPARERREANPIATGLGNTLPVAAAAALLAPATGGGSLAATFGADLLSGATQEAVDAELENRDISGEDILRNGALNAAFSLGAMGLGGVGRSLLKGGKNVVESSAEKTLQSTVQKAAASEGAELADAVADGTAKSELLNNIGSKVEDVLSKTDRAIKDVKAPKVSNNPNAQRSAIEAIGDAFEKTEPDAVALLREVQKTTGARRLDNLRSLRQAVDADSDLGKAIDNVLTREDLWGDDAIKGATNLDEIIAARPGPGATPEQLMSYADKLRTVAGGKLYGYADEIQHLAERTNQINLASEIGGQTAEKTSKAIDYNQIAKDLTPDEAYRLKQGGGIESARKLEAHTVADNFDNVNQVMKDDISMATKRDDFVKGAEGWSPAQIEKQNGFAGEMFDKAAELAKLAEESRGLDAKYNWKGTAQDIIGTVNPALERIANADPVTRNYELDLLKRNLDSIAVKIDASRTLDESAKRHAMSSVLDLSNQLRKGLESTEMFGRNAGLQEATNSAWKKLIDPYKRVKTKMAEYLGREFGNVGEMSGAMNRFRPDQIEKIMAGGYDRNLRNDLGQAIAGIDDLMKARQTQGLSRLEDLAQARGQLQRIKDAFEFNDVLRVADKVAVEPAGTAAIKRGIGAAVGAAGGFAQGGPIGSAVGGALGSLADRFITPAAEKAFKTGSMIKPGSTSEFTRALRHHMALARTEQKALLENPAFARGELSSEFINQLGQSGTKVSPEFARQVGAATEGAADKTVQLASAVKDAAVRQQKTAARALVSPEVADRLLRVLGDVAAPLARFQGENETPEQAFIGYRKLIENFRQEPQQLINLLTEEFGDIGNQSPALQRAMIAKSIQVATYLEKNLPGRRNVSVVYPNGTPPSQAEIRAFALKFVTATDPSSVYDDALRGRLQRVQVETLKELWPREYSNLKMAVIEQLGNGRVTTLTRQRMNVLFGFGGAVDPALGPKVSAMADAARAAQGKQDSRSAPALNKSSLPSNKTETPGGLASLQLGQSLTF